MSSQPSRKLDSVPRNHGPLRGGGVTGDSGDNGVLRACASGCSMPPCAPVRPRVARNRERSMSTAHQRLGVHALSDPPHVSRALHLPAPGRMQHLAARVASCGTRARSFAMPPAGHPGCGNRVPRSPTRRAPRRAARPTQGGTQSPRDPMAARRLTANLGGAGGRYQTAQALSRAEFLSQSLLSRLLLDPYPPGHGPTESARSAR